MFSDKDLQCMLCKAGLSISEMAARAGCFGDAIAILEDLLIKVAPFCDEFAADDAVKTIERLRILEEATKHGKDVP